MKQTAVEWLIKELENQYIKTSGPYDVKMIIGIKEIERSKEMEKQQIIDAYLKDRRRVKFDVALKWIDDAEQYYNKTYKSE